MTRFYTFSEPMSHSYDASDIAAMSDEELIEEINSSGSWDADLLADLIWRAFPDFDEPWEVGDSICYDAAKALGSEI